MILSNTAGENSRTRKLTVAQVKAIRKEWAAGKRGKERAKFHGISPSHYNQIGRRALWRTV